MTIRTSGGNLHCTSEEMTAEQVEAIGIELAGITADFQALVVKLGMFGEQPRG